MTSRIGNSQAEKLIGTVRELVQATGLDYVIENVVGARADLVKPIMLCGGSFPELWVYRHRLFETSFPVPEPKHEKHAVRQPKMGRPVARGEYIQVVGHFSNVEYAREAMGISWMTRAQLKEAIPPAYTHYIGAYLLFHLGLAMVRQTSTNS